MARLYWPSSSRGPRFSMRYFDSQREVSLTSGELSGTPQQWRHLLASPTLTLDAGGADALGTLLFAGSNLASLREALHDGLERFGASMPSIEQVLPIFAASDRTFVVERWTWVLYGAISQMGDEAQRIELISQTAVAWTSTPDDQPVRLPIDIDCPRSIADAVQSSNSFLTREDIPTNGIRIHPIDDRLPASNDSDISVTDASQVAADEAALARWLRTDFREGRLKIVMSARAGIEAGRLSRMRGAKIFVPIAIEPPYRLLISLIREVSHDHPLHQVVANLRRHNFPIDYGNSIVRIRLDQWLKSPRLYSDPRTNEWFRLSRALPQVVVAANEASTVGLRADIASFVGRLRPRVSANVADTVAGELHSLQEASTRLTGVLSKGVRFDFESTGLGPMSSILAARQSLDSKLQDVTRILTEVRQDPAFDEALEQTQERKVDAELQLVRPWSDVHALGPQAHLNPGRTVRLQVHIGQRNPESLIVGDTPSLDPLLPPLEGEESHELDIVVYPKDFTFVAGHLAVRKVLLPRFGGSIPVSWDLRVPELRPSNHGHEEQVDEGGPRVNTRGRGWISGDTAELRFSVYFKNQLLQSFALTATVRPEKDWRLAGGLKIICDFSRTRRFGKLDELDDRFVALCLNKNSDGRHMLGLKFDDGEPTALEWEGSALSNYTKRLRSALYSALAPNGESNFLFTESDLSIYPRTPTAFDDAVRLMAQAGARIFTELVNTHDDDVVEVLRAIRVASGQTIQVTLLHPTFSLPWAVLYDYEISAETPIEELSVCHGRTATGSACQCSPTAGKSICLRGFWGFRHVVEQLVDGLPPLDDVPGRISASPVATALGLINTYPDAFTDGLIQTLKATAGLPSEVFVNPKAVLPLLRDDLKRPAILMYVGHQINAGSDDAPEPEFRGVDDMPILRLADVSAERLNYGPWKAPRSLLMLLGCATGNTRVDTGISLAGALLRLGAVGVVGTECTVYTPVVAHLARQIFARLAKREQIGKALSEAIWKLADDGCPMGLIFTYIGSAEAHLP